MINSLENKEIQLKEQMNRDKGKEVLSLHFFPPKNLTVSQHCFTCKSNKAYTIC